jgi:hypothetical protein
MHGGWHKTEIHPFRPEWLSEYDRAGIDFRNLKCEPITWWDREVANLIAENGSKSMSKLAIWDKNWTSIGHQIGLNPSDLADPRSLWQKSVHRLLFATQKHRSNWGVRAFERLLRVTGW